MKVRILIADDHALVRDGLRMNLEARGDLVGGQPGKPRRGDLGVDALAQDRGARGYSERGVAGRGPLLPSRRSRI